jgi:hypothetical protein
MLGVNRWRKRLFCEIFVTMSYPNSRKAALRKCFPGTGEGLQMR